MAESRQEPVEAIQSAVLKGVPHGFMSRRGGVSTGELAGLNCGPGSGDEAAAIAENRVRVVNAVYPSARLVSVYQVHSPDCVVVREPWSDDDRPSADAMVSNVPGLLLGVLTADCAPVLLVDHEAGVVGAAHAGWKGAIGGVTDRTIEAMVALGAKVSRIAAAIGPCIAQASYEVDEAFKQRFEAADRNNACFFAVGAPGHYQFDLEGYVAHRLESAQIGQVERLGLDTYGAPERFFSYRRATHRGEASYGRQISVIGAPLQR